MLLGLLCVFSRSGRTAVTVQMITLRSLSQAVIKGGLPQGSYKVQFTENSHQLRFCYQDALAAFSRRPLAAMSCQSEVRSGTTGVWLKNGSFLPSWLPSSLFATLGLQSLSITLPRRHSFGNRGALAAVGGDTLRGLGSSHSLRMSNNCHAGHFALSDAHFRQWQRTTTDVCARTFWMRVASQGASCDAA